MPLLTLAPEILLEIASNSSINSIYSLVLSCRYLNHTLTETLYSFPLRRPEYARRYGLGALLSAANRRDVYTVEKMLKWGILKRLWQANREIEKLLLEEKDKYISALETLLFCGMDPVMPLMPLADPSLPFLEIAAWAGNAPAVRALLACPRIVVGPRGIHPPPLIRAVWRGDVEIVKILCEDERIDVNAEDGGAEDNRLLVTAAEYRHWEIVRYLLRRRDINVEVLCKSAKTVLYWAVEDGNLDMVKLLVEEGGADVNLNGGSWHVPYNRDEPTLLLPSPLHLAAIYGHLSVVKFLVKCEGVDINARDTRGDSPLDYARRRKNKKIVRVLKNNGAIGKGYEEPRQFRRKLMGLKIFGCFSEHV